jgi:hypothetical protein
MSRHEFFYDIMARQEETGHVSVSSSDSDKNPFQPLHATVPRGSKHADNGGIVVCKPVIFRLSGDCHIG